MPDETPPDPSALPGDAEFRAQVASIPLPATTTAQQDLTTAGQRKVNLIWEYTQAVIALTLVGAAVACGVHIAFSGKPEQQIPTILSTLAAMVVGSYFQRTNHMNIGGVGSKVTEKDKYDGR